MQLSIEISEALTWAELIGFVDAARAHVSPAQLVDILPVDNMSDWTPDRLRVEIPNPAPSVKVLEESQAHELLAVLEAVINNDGDARIVLDELARLRDLLV